MATARVQSHILTSHVMPFPYPHTRRMQNHQLSTAAMGAMRKGQVAFPVVSQWVNDVGSGAGYTLGLIAGEGARGRARWRAPPGGGR